MADNQALMNQILQRMMQNMPVEQPKKTPEEIRKEKISQALAAAGAAMTASQSPDALAGISQGITAGVGAYHNYGQGDDANDQRLQNMKLMESMLGGVSSVERSRLAAQGQSADISNMLRDDEFRGNKFKYEQGQDAIKNKQAEADAALAERRVGLQEGQLSRQEARDRNQANRDAERIGLARKADARAEEKAKREADQAQQKLKNEEAKAAATAAKAKADAEWREAQIEGSQTDKFLRAEELIARNRENLNLNDPLLDDDERAMRELEHDAYAKRIQSRIEQKGSGSSAAAAKPKSKFTEGQKAQDANGNIIVFRGGRWVRE